MGSRFDSLMAAVGSPVLDHQFGEAVSITRGANTTASVTASWTNQTDEIAKTDDKSTGLVDRFWFVKQSAYVLQDSAVEPRTGDRLTDEGGNVWEVLPARTLSPVVSVGDDWKIATKRVT